VYSAGPSPKRKPQLRQNRNSFGIGVWQFAQVVTALSISGFIDISQLDVSRESVYSAAN
jgi:hypothetical protein